MKLKLTVSRNKKQLFALEAQKAAKIKELLQEFPMLDDKFPESEGYRVTLSLLFSAFMPMHRIYVREMVEDGSMPHFLEKMKAEWKQHASMDGAAWLIYWTTRP